MRIPLLDETQTCNFTRPPSSQKCLKEASGQRESLQKLTGILLVRVVRAERRRRSPIYSTCTSSPSAGSHLERGSTRPTATVGTACVYLFIPATAAPAISVRRFPNAASRHMTQQPSVHLAGMRALPSLRANRRARISHQPDWSAHPVLALANFIFGAAVLRFATTERRWGGLIGSGSRWSDGGG